MLCGVWLCFPKQKEKRTFEAPIFCFVLFSLFRCYILAFIESVSTIYCCLMQCQYRFKCFALNVFLYSHNHYSSLSVISIQLNLVFEIEQLIVDISLNFCQVYQVMKWFLHNLSKQTFCNISHWFFTLCILFTKFNSTFCFSNSGRIEIQMVQNSKLSQKLKTEFAESLSGSTQRSPYPIRRRK